MKRLVLLRHGESQWNRENRFTGWTDVPLSERGIEEARTAGRTLLAEGFAFDLALHLGLEARRSRRSGPRLHSSKWT